MSEQATPAVNTPSAPGVKLTRYRLLAGFHHEGILGTDKTRLIEPGQIFESPHDWYVDKWPEKFAYAEGTRGQVTGFNWNPAQESLQEFAQRMQTMQNAAHLKQAQNQQKPTSIDPNVALANEIENLNTMTVSQLKAYASEWEIDLQGASKREDILRLIVDSMRSVATTIA